MAKCQHYVEITQCKKCMQTSFFAPSMNGAQRQALAIDLAAEQVAQGQTANTLLAHQLAQQEAHHAQMLAANRAAEEARVRSAVALWRQTPEGRHYEEWSAAAQVLLSRLSAVDDFWRSTWYQIVASRVPAESLEPVPTVSLGPAKGLGAFAAFVVFIGLFWNLAWWTGLLMAVGAVVWAVKLNKKRTAAAALDDQRRATRTAVLGVDVLDASNIPDWSADIAPGYGQRDLERQIVTTLRNGAAAFPSPADLPTLMVPPVKRGCWPGEVEGVAEQVRDRLNAEYVA